jgi:hypothetical protein
MSVLARHALGHPRLWLVLIGLLTTGLGSGLLRLELRTEGAALHPMGHPGIDAAERDRLRFLDPRQVVLLAHAPPGAPSLASPTGFRFVRELHRGLRALSTVRSDGVVSIASLLRVTPETAGLSLGAWLDSIPDDPSAFAELVERIREVSGTDGLLLSADGRLAAFYLPLSEDRAVPALVDELQAWLDAYPAAPFELWLTGPQVAEATLGDMVLSGSRRVRARHDGRHHPAAGGDAPDSRWCADPAGRGGAGADLGLRQHGLGRRSRHAGHDDPAGRADGDGDHR